MMNDTWCMMMHDAAWCCMMMRDDAWWCMMMHDDVWWCTMMLNTQMLEVFTRTSWAAETLLHTNPFPHRSFHTEKPYTRVCFAHRKSSCTEASTQRSRCTGQLWHNDVFTHESFYTEEPFVAQRKTCISPPLGCPTHTIAAERRTCTTTFAFHRAFAKLPQPPQEEGQHCRCLVRFCFFRRFREVDQLDDMLSMM